MLLDQPAHRVRAEPDGLHVKRADGAFEVSGQISELRDDALGRQLRETCDEASHLGGRLFTRGWGGSHHRQAL